MSNRIVHLNLDTVISAMEARPETKARRDAWEWLVTVDTVTFEGDALVVPSLTWSNTTYRTTLTSCTCPARKPCKHMEAAAIVAAALAEDAHYDALAEASTEALPFDLAADLVSYPIAIEPTRMERKAKAYREMAELFA